MKFRLARAVAALLTAFGAVALPLAATPAAQASEKDCVEFLKSISFGPGAGYVCWLAKTNPDGGAEAMESAGMSGEEIAIALSALQD
ncbi:hypothetical protein [Amycolatopsis magusensis]|uniref:hypothetical protein n=1 Tax=Amycolatopsis magusensis TaxID=882444 RepID=UPI003C2AC751